MPIPGFQEFFLPALKVFADDQLHGSADIATEIAKQFNLSDDDKKEMLPSGKQSRFVNRIAWTIVHLRRAAIIESISRGQYRITERGKQVVASGASRLDVKYLMRFPEYKQFRDRKDDEEGDSANVTSTSVVSAQDQTPTEKLENTYQGLRRELADDILDKVKTASPRYFEQIVVDLLVAMGYGGSHAEAGQKTRYTADGGVDGIIKEDKLGLDNIYLQAKRWEATVGRPVVQAFAGSLEGFRARKGVLITTSQFSSDAKEYVDRIEKKIVLIDGEQLAELMIDHNVGVTVQNTYVLKRVDGDYFEEE
jgi:restriction system protein